MKLILAAAFLLWGQLALADETAPEQIHNSMSAIHPSAPVIFFIPTPTFQPARGEYDYGIYIQLKPDGTSVRLEIAESGPPAYCTGTYHLTMFMLAEKIDKCGLSLDALKTPDKSGSAILISKQISFANFINDRLLSSVRPVTERDPAMRVTLSIRINDQDVQTDERPIFAFGGSLPF